MKPRVKKILLAVLRFGLPTLLITYLLWRVEAESWDLFFHQEKRWDLMVVALVISFVATVISFVRWWMLVHCLGIPLGLMESMRLGAIGYLLSYITPGSVGGDLIKAVFVAHRRPDRRIEALASIGVDRVMGLTALLIVVSLSLLIFDVPSTDPVYLTLRSSVLIATPIGLVGLAALTFGGKLVDRMLEALRKTPLVGPGLYRICEFVRIFNVHRGTMLVVLVMSAVVHAGLIVSVDLIARALFERPPSFKEHLVIVPASLAATALPVTPAGLGVMEGCMEYLYRVIPTPALDGKGMGTLVALVYDFSRIVLAIVGVIFYWTAGREVRDSIEAVESEEETETLTNEMAPNKSMDGSEETETPYSPPQFQ